MRPLPNTANTVANLVVSGGALIDISGNGLNPASVHPITEAPLAPTIVTLDGCTQAVDTTYTGLVNNSKFKIGAGQAGPLRFTGPFGFQWIGQQTQTFEIAHFVACNPDNVTPHRDGSPDRIGSLYSIFSFGGDIEIADEHIGSNLPTVGYGVCPTSSNTTWGRVGLSTPGPLAAFAVTRDVSGNYHFYRNGVLVGTVASAGAAVAQGNECFYMGGAESNGTFFGNCGGSLYANIRIVNVEPSAAQIAADAIAALGPCAANFQFKGTLVKIRTAA